MNIKRATPFFIISLIFFVLGCMTLGGLAGGGSRTPVTIPGGGVPPLPDSSPGWHGGDWSSENSPSSPDSSGGSNSGSWNWGGNDGGSNSGSWNWGGDSGSNSGSWNWGGGSNSGSWNFGGGGDSWDGGGGSNSGAW